MENFKFLGLVLFCSILISCGDKTNEQSSTIQETDTNYTKVDSLTSTYLSIQDSIVKYWNVMIHDDNEKLSTMKRVLEELEYAGGIDSVGKSELFARIDGLKSVRYDRMTMANSDLIDEYDLASSTVVNEVVEITQSFKEFERYPLLQQFIEEISQSESNILFRRLDYDEWAILHNSFLKENSSLMHEIDGEKQHDPLPLFQTGAMVE